jgi:hypothetical protein
MIDETNNKLECGMDYVLTPEEDLAVDIIYWARNRRAGLENAIQLGLFPGPSGRLDAKKLWWPANAECCDALDIAHFCTSDIINPKTGRHKLICSPYAYRKHCCTKKHITYLLKHRLCVLQSRDFYSTAVKPLMTVVKNGVGLYVNSDNPIVREFVRDALSGKNWDTTKYFGDLYAVKE